MKNQLKVDFNKKQLIMDKTFSRKATIYGSDEYYQLQDARRDYPKFQVVVRTIKKNPHKESYRGLTYAYMEMYIADHDPTGMIAKEFAELRLLTQCHSIRFPHIKKWFLDTYPTVKQYSIHPTVEETQIPQSNSAEVISLPQKTDDADALTA